MNIISEFRRDEGRVLDRLVDGELSQDQRRELLAALDDEPGAWRRCALAFLEAQSWRWQLSRVAVEPLVAQTSARSASPESRKSRAPLWGMCVAIAASVVAAFGLGVQYQSAGQRLHASNTAPRTGKAESVALAQGDWADSQTDAVDSDLQDRDSLDEETIALTLADDDDGEREIQLPVTRATEDEQWVQDSSALPVGLLRSLRQAGLEVNRQQRYMPIDLSDGRRLIVPVEEIEIHDPQLVQF